jgi:hypothetical protein
MSPWLRKQAWNRREGSLFFKFVMPALVLLDNALHLKRTQRCRRPVGILLVFTFTPGLAGDFLAGKESIRILLEEGYDFHLFGCHKQKHPAST